MPSRADGRGAGRRVVPVFVVLSLVLIGVLGGSDGLRAGRGSPAVRSGPPYTLRVLADGELADMRPILDRAATATGVKVVLDPTTTLAGTAAVAHGDVGTDHHAVWLASNDYLEMNPDAMARVATSNRIMSSPVVLGLRPQAADRLGGGDLDLSWADIATAAQRKQFTFGMADPAASNTGVAALVGVATAAAGDGAALDRSGVARAEDRLKGLFGAQSLKAHSSAALVDQFVAGSATGRPVDGLIEYESVLLSLNDSKRLPDPLRIVYPNDGVATADYPLTLLTVADPAARDAYLRLVEYLRGADGQREIQTETARRPVVPGVRPAGSPGLDLFELPFPARTDVVDALVAAYYGRLRRPARTVYVLDSSGSMAGPRLTALKAALDRLAAERAPGSSSAARFQEREQATLLPFRGTPDRPTTFVLPNSELEPTLRRIRTFTTTLRADGGTGIYAALAEAYRIAEQQAAAEPDRIATIVLLTDGENTTGPDLAAFGRFHRGLPASVASVPVFPVLFGESNVAQMRKVATVTGGRVFDARRDSLDEVFARIRADQ